MFSKITSSKGKRGRQPLLERERDAEGSCSEGGGGIAQECNHGFGVEEGLSWLAELAGGREESDPREKTHLLDRTKQREVKKGLSPVQPGRGCKSHSSSMALPCLL